MKGKEGKRRRKEGGEVKPLIHIFGYATAHRTSHWILAAARPIFSY